MSAIGQSERTTRLRDEFGSDFDCHYDSYRRPKCYKNIQYSMQCVYVCVTFIDFNTVILCGWKNSFAFFVEPIFFSADMPGLRTMSHR